jgi:hypothetical protein
MSKSEHQGFGVSAEKDKEKEAPVSEHAGSHEEAAKQHKSNGNGEVKGPIGPSLLALPAGFNSSAIIRDPKGGRGPSVYTIPVTGAFQAGVALAIGNNINLCYVPFNSFLLSYQIVTSGVTGTLQDSLASPTAYGTLAGAIITNAAMTAPQAQNLGTMYCSTPRAIGATGCRVVQWQPGTMLQIIVAAALTPATPVSFVVQWAPAYDGGV